MMLIEKLMTFTYQQFWFGISEKLLSLGIQESGFFGGFSWLCVKEASESQSVTEDIVMHEYDVIWMYLKAILLRAYQ